MILLFDKPSKCLHKFDICYLMIMYISVVYIHTPCFMVIYIAYLRTVFVTYTFRSLFIISCSTFRLIKAFIKKVFLSMSPSLHTAYAHHFECFCYIERKTFLIKALISQNVEEDVMNKLRKVHISTSMFIYAQYFCMIILRTTLYCYLKTGRKW